MYNTDKIGRQEIAAIVGLPIYTSLIFTIDTQASYSSGNSSYIWLPISAVLSLFAAIFILGTMNKCDIEGMDSLLKRAFGRLPGSVVCAAVILLLLFEAMVLLNEFVDMAHSFAFYDSAYWAIIIWIIAATAFLSFGGLERVSRTALIYAPVFIIMLLFSLIKPIESYELHRIFPLPGNSLAEIAQKALSTSVCSFGAAVGPAIIARSTHSVLFGRSSCKIGGIIAVILVLLTQLALSLAYSYTDLSDMVHPIYRLDMVMVKEGYFFRIDNLLLFFWLSMAMISAACYVIYASTLCVRFFGVKDQRLISTVINIVLLALLLLNTGALEKQFASVYSIVNSWGWLLLPIIVSGACIARMRNKTEVKA